MSSRTQKAAKMAPAFGAVLMKVENIQIRDRRRPFPNAFPPPTLSARDYLGNHQEE